MLAIPILSLLLPPLQVPNGGFEALAGPRPAGWSSTAWAGQAEFGTAPGRDGGRAIVIRSAGGADAAWHQTVPVRPFSRYRLTAWIRTEGVAPVRNGLGALLNVHGRPERTAAVAGDQDWRQVSTDVDTGGDDSLWINCLLGYFGTARGAAYFDDVELQLIETRTPRPQATIEAGSLGEPISPYFYSQFIEHLGRCIYGGIWAEMLEDRKFFLPVGTAGSPWRAMPEASVRMDRREPFVGEHTPMVRGGLRQSGLWLQKGRRYVGRIWLQGDSGTRSVQVRLGGAIATAVAPAGQWRKTEFSFLSDAETRDAALEISSPGPFRIGTISLMPADHVRGMRRDTLAVLRRLNAPLYRWPGGNFVSGYDWRDGIGDPDRRPPRKNPAWEGIEHNDFGTHEFLDFCRELGTEPLIVVNTGFGDSASAAQWLEYANGPRSSPMGAVRAAHGRSQPWGVRWWGIGNEMFGSWQLGYMAIGQYVLKHNDVVARMRKVDPSIKTIAVGEVGGDWSRRMLTECADSMDLISEHFYCQERTGVMAHAALIPSAIKAKVAAHRAYRNQIPSLRGKDIRIAMDEWNYWYGPHVFGELGTRYFQKDALGIAAGLHEFFRSTDIVAMAQYAQAVNVIGCVKTTPVAASLETTGLVLELYRREFGTIPVRVGGAPEPLDVMAAWTPDRKAMTIGIVNPTAERVRLPISWQGFQPSDSGVTWEIAHSDPMAFNTPGEQPRVETVRKNVTGLGSGIEVAPYSVTLVRIPAGVTRPSAGGGHKGR